MNESNYYSFYLTFCLLILLFYIIVIFILSFYLKKNYLSKNWDEHRCNYLLFSGYLTPDKNVSSSQYTIDNMKYCIKQHIYKNNGVLPHLKDKYNKLKYIINYINKQIGIYHNYLNKSTQETSDLHQNEIYNKINYLKHKHKQLTKINDKINSEIIPITEKINIGTKYYDTYMQDKKNNKIYEDPDYLENYIK